MRIYDPKSPAPSRGRVGRDTSESPPAAIRFMKALVQLPELSALVFSRYSANTDHETTWSLRA